MTMLILVAISSGAFLVVMGAHRFRRRSKGRSVQPVPEWVRLLMDEKPSIVRESCTVRRTRCLMVDSEDDSFRRGYSRGPYLPPPATRRPTRLR